MQLDGAKCQKSLSILLWTRRLNHWPSGLVGWVTQNTTPTRAYSPQSSSSAPLEQSVERSHRHDKGTHWPSPHLYSEVPHVAVEEEEEEEEEEERGRGAWHNTLPSSRPSRQSGRPSHSLAWGRQGPEGGQRKAPEEQFRQEVSSLPSLQLTAPSQRRCRETQWPLRHANSSSLQRRSPARDSYIHTLHSDAPIPSYSDYAVT